VTKIKNTIICNIPTNFYFVYKNINIQFVYSNSTLLLNKNKTKLE
jgi:hypothetical protein